MKSVKVLVAALALCVMAPVPALQAKPNDKTIEKIDKTVGGLTGYQKWKIDNILVSAEAQVQALSQAERRTQGQEIRKASMLEVRKHLTPAQQRKFDALPK